MKFVLPSILVCGMLFCSQALAQSLMPLKPIKAGERYVVVSGLKINEVGTGDIVEISGQSAKETQEVLFVLYGSKHTLIFFRSSVGADYNNALVRVSKKLSRAPVQTNLYRLGAPFKDRALKRGTKAGDRRAWFGRRLQGAIDVGDELVFKQGSTTKDRGEVRGILVHKNASLVFFEAPLEGNLTSAQAFYQPNIVRSEDIFNLASPRSSVPGTKTETKTKTETVTENEETEETEETPKLLSLDSNHCYRVGALNYTEARDYNKLGETDQFEYLTKHIRPTNPKCISIKAEDIDNSNHTQHLRMAFAVAELEKLPLNIIGQIATKAPITISKSLKVSGVGEAAGIKNTSGNAISTLLKIDVGVENVELEKLRLDEGPAGLTQALIVLQENNKDVTIRNLEFIGNGFEQGETMAGILSARGKTERVTLEKSSFEGLSYGINLGSAVKDLEFKDLQFSGWGFFAVRVLQGKLAAKEASTDLTITGSTFSNPAKFKGRRGVLLISRGVNRPYFRNVNFQNNTIDGPDVPFVKGNATSTLAVGDMLALHGVQQFNIADNDISGGSENGVTLSRMTREGTFERNKVYDVDAFGLAIGSGYYEVKVDDASNVAMGQKLQGSRSGAHGIVTGIFDKVLALDPVLGGANLVNEPLDNITTGAKGVANITLSDRTRAIKILNNEFKNNGRNRGEELSVVREVLVQNSDAVTIKDNRFVSEIYNEGPTEYNSVLLSNARNIVIDNSNHFESLSGVTNLDTALVKTRSSTLK